jgi:hypothetical protein
MKFAAWLLALLLATPVHAQIMYPPRAIPVVASATGTVAVTTATLPASANMITNICGFSIRSTATAAVTGNATVTGTGTMNFTQAIPASPQLGSVDYSFIPCIPGTAINTAIAVNSIAPGSGGIVSVTAWGFQLR